MNLSTLSLFISNLIIIVLAIIQTWDIATVLWVYWMQSIIIGFFQFLRILSLKNFSTENFKINNQPATSTQSTKTFTAFFFAFHYGFFHFIYAIFLFNFFQNDTNFNLQNILIGFGVFFTNHLFSFIHNKISDEKLKPNIGTLMFQPYLRIIPMHLIIILGAMFENQTKLIFFLSLKTLADLIFHILKHKTNRS